MPRSRDQPTVLIADADPRTRMQLALALRRQQLRVIECSLARDVPTLLARERPAVAIVDERLPGPARRIMSELRDDAATRLITIGAGERGDAARFARPLDIEGIVEEVAALLGRPKVTSDLGGALDRLRAAYGQALPAKLDALERLCQEAQGDDAALTKARDAAHKLRGTAGSCGFHDVSRLAGRVELLLREHDERAQLRWTEVLATIDEVRAGLRDPPR
ncbi:MAG: response regulator [Myxococcales bacterium]|nr:response regulator [Myxococcales bacterium]